MFKVTFITLFFTLVVDFLVEYEGFFKIAPSSLLGELEISTIVLLRLK